MTIVPDYWNTLLKPGLRDEMFQDPTRCQSKLWVKQDGEWLFRNCCMSAGHVGSHKKYRRLGDNRRGIWVHWSEEDSIQSQQEKFKDENKIHKVTTPIYGWRCWRWGGTWKLLSTARDVVWESPVMTTELDKEGVPRRVFPFNHSPEHGKDYGVYCYKTLRKLKEYFYYSLSSRPCGKVEVKLGAVEHEIGYRAQMLVIQELYFSRKVRMPGDLKERLEEIYHCPVVEFKEEKDFHAWMDYTSQEELSNG